VYVTPKGVGLQGGPKSKHELRFITRPTSNTGRLSAFYWHTEQ